MGSLLGLLKRERTLAILTGITVLLLSLSFSLWINLFYASILTPEFLYSDTIFPILKSERLYGNFIQAASSFLNVPLAIAAISILLLFIFLVLFFLKNRKEINVISFVIALATFPIILCCMFFSCEENFYYVVVKLFIYFQYLNSFIDAVIFYWLTYLSLFCFGILAFYIPFTNIKSSLKVCYNILIVFLIIIFPFVTVYSADYYNNIRYVNNIDYKNIKGLELYNPKNAIWLLSIDNRKKSISEVLQKPYNKEKDPPSAKYAFNENNFKVLSAYASSNTTFYKTNFTFFWSLFRSSFNLSAIEKYCAVTFKRNTDNIFSIAFFGTILCIRPNPDVKSLKIVESVYNDPSMYISNESKCVLSLIQYKLGKFKEAKINSKVPCKDNQYCELTIKLLSGKIKKTTFTGVLIESNKPLSNNKILLSKFANNFAILGATDLANTNKNGQFSLQAETDQPLYLVVVSNKPKKISFDYKKLSNYKQGSTINLGKVVINN